MSKKILVIDDELDFVKMVQMRLQASGYEVAVAFDGKEGLKKTQEEMPDLILLDIGMPRKDGYTFLLDLKKDKSIRSIPVIVVTARGGMKDIARLEGAKDYVVKPIDSTQLLSKIKKTIG